MGAAVNGDRGLVQLLPFQVEPIPLYHRHRIVIGGAHCHQSHLAQRGDHSISTDGEDSGASTEAVDQQMGSGLGRGDDIRGGRGDAKLDKVIGDGGRRAGSIVGNEADLGATSMELGNALCRAGHGERAQIDHPIKIEQHRIVGVDDCSSRIHSGLSYSGMREELLPAPSSSS
jgi:hypothetical protein